MLLLFMALTSAPGFSSAIKAVSASDWITPDDYPRVALRRDEQGYVALRVEIAPDGKPSRCDVTVSSGSPILDRATCAIILQRAQFRPISDADGQPIAGVFRSATAWIIPSVGKIIPPSNIDLDLMVNALPAKVKSPAVVNAQVIVDAKGAIEKCTPDWGDALPALGGVACRQISTDWHPEPAHDASGSAVRSVQVVRVRFTLGAATRIDTPSPRP